MQIATSIVIILAGLWFLRKPISVTVCAVGRFLKEAWPAILFTAGTFALVIFIAWLITIAIPATIEVYKFRHEAPSYVPIVIQEDGIPKHMITPGIRLGNAADPNKEYTIISHDDSDSGDFTLVPEPFPFTLKPEALKPIMDKLAEILREIRKPEPGVQWGSYTNYLSDSDCHLLGVLSDIISTNAIIIKDN